jgi:hypothetical protein
MPKVSISSPPPTLIVGFCFKMAPSNEGWHEIHVGIALTVIAAVAVGLRFVARYVRKLKWELDDWFSIASLIFIVAMFIELVIWATIGNNGKHINTLDLNEIQQFFKVCDNKTTQKARD